MSALPVSVISPVWNCAKDMPTHAAHLREMAAAVEEIIIVDSGSQDGTVEILQRELEGLNVVFLTHPPGLYQSWNHAISHAKAPYLTVATVGDPLPVESLRQLVDTMQRFSADVVITAPEILNNQGEPLPKKWPVHRFLDATKITEPHRISGATWLTLGAVFYPMTLISSSAGNLYRTRLMKDHPFPTEYGHAGDSAWSLQMSRNVRWVIDPRVKSYFWLHAAAPARKAPNEAVARRTHAMFEDVLSKSAAFLKEEGVPDEMMETISGIPGQLLQKALLAIRYSSVRKSWLPWFLQPEAREIRKEREQLINSIKKRREKTFAFAKEMNSRKDGLSAE